MSEYVATVVRMQVCTEFAAGRNPIIRYRVCFLNHKRDNESLMSEDAKETVIVG